MCFLVAAHLLLTLVPLIEGRSGADSKPHVEAAGTSSHHAHNPSDCAACGARTLLAVTHHAATTAIAALPSAAPGLSERDEHLDVLRKSKSRPRAPPVRQA
jgi:hypothetical protein